jgi:hypothetical protein
MYLSNTFLPIQINVSQNSNVAPEEVTRTMTGKIDDIRLVRYSFGFDNDSYSNDSECGVVLILLSAPDSVTAFFLLRRLMIGLILLFIVSTTPDFGFLSRHSELAWACSGRHLILCRNYFGDSDGKIVQIYDGANRKLAAIRLKFGLRSDTAVISAYAGWR